MNHITPKILIVFLSLIILIIFLNFFVLKPSKNNEIVIPSMYAQIMNKKVKMYTGSFCTEKQCIDRLNSTDIEYKEKIIAIPGEKIEFTNLDSKIEDIKIYECSSRINEVNNLDIIVTKDNSLVVPNREGLYIIDVITKYNNHDITYSFKLKINKIDYEYLEFINNLKYNLQKDGYINNNVKEFRIVRIIEYGYYEEEPNKKYYQADLYITCQENTKCTNNINYYDWEDKNNSFEKSQKYNYSIPSIILENNSYIEINNEDFKPEIIKTEKIILNINQ